MISLHFQKLKQTIASSQIWKSIVRHGSPNTPKTRILVIVSNFFLHIHPVSVRESGLKIGYTWCMGGISCFLFIIEMITGVLLMFYYRPSVDYAYFDIIALKEHVPFGILREIHRWGGHAMVITVVLHMFRVFMSGSYKPPREFNWVIGVILLVCTFFLSFTGYLLPWDQLAFWAITVGSNMASAVPLLGHEGPGSMLLQSGHSNLIHSGNDIRFMLLGEETIGQTALLRFYVLHCVFIPMFVCVLMAVHFWRVRKDGGISGPL